MAAAKHAPLVVWSWKTDQGNWHAYPPALCDSLEDAWKGKVTRYPVDADRFVDTVKMVQKRLDMTGKAREVKREPQPALKHHVFAMIGPLQASVVNAISNHGGVATLYITEKVTLAICDAPQDHADALAEAKSLKIAVVSSHAVQELITKLDKADISRFEVDLKNLTVLSDTTGSWKGAKAAPAAKVAKKTAVAKLAKPQGLPWRNGYTKPLDASTEWMGVLSLPGDAPLAVILQVNFFSPSGEWTGILTSPTSGSTQISGIVVPGGGPLMENGDASHTFQCRTHNLISGTDARIQNLTLTTGHIDTCTRTIKVPQILTLSYVRHIPATPLPFLQPSTTWNGTSTTSISRFELTVAKNQGNKIEGSIHWPEFDATNTFQGNLNGLGNVEITEKPAEGMTLDVEMPPTTYTLKMIPQLTSDPKNAAFKGTWSSETEDGPSSGPTYLTPVP